MLMLCNKCNEHSDVRLKKGTLVAFCTNCQEEPTLTSFALQAMKSNGDFLEEKDHGFSFMCESCSEKKKGVIDRPTGKVVCTACDGVLKVTPHMVSAMKSLNIFREG